MWTQQRASTCITSTNTTSFYATDKWANFSSDESASTGSFITSDKVTNTSSVYATDKWANTTSNNSLANS